MSRIEIKHRFSGEVLFSLEISEEISALSWGVRLGLAVKAAIAAKAILSGANLSEANLSEAPVIPALDTKILAAIAAGGGLDMGSWHTCETTHCRAGWAITLAGDEGKSLENKFGPDAAGALIYGASYPSLPVPNFYASNTEAMEDMRARAAQDGVS